MSKLLLSQMKSKSFRSCKSSKQVLFHIEFLYNVSIMLHYSSEVSLSLSFVYVSSRELNILMSPSIVIMHDTNFGCILYFLAGC